MSYDKYCSERACDSSDGESNKQLTTIHESHKEGADEAAAEEQYHGDDIVGLCRCFVHSKIVCVVYDKCPDHDLCCHVEHLRENSFAINLVFPKAGECFSVRVVACLLIFLARCLYFCDGY